MIPFPFWNPLEPYPALINYVPVNTFPDKLSPNVPNNIGRSSLYFSFTSFRIVSKTPFSNKTEPARY